MPPEEGAVAAEALWMSGARLDHNRWERGRIRRLRPRGGLNCADAAFGDPGTVRSADQLLRVRS